MPSAGKRTAFTQDDLESPDVSGGGARAIYLTPHKPLAKWYAGKDGVVLGINMQHPSLKHHWFHHDDEPLVIKD